MSRKIHSHKRSHTKRSPKRKPNHVHVPKRKYDWRTKILAGAAAFALLAGGTLAHWRARSDEVLIAKDIHSPVKNIPALSTTSASELSDIPPEALHPQPPMMAGGYNAHSGGLPPGALPPGVVLPGMPTMQDGRTTAQGYGVPDGVRQQFTGKERDTETGLDYFGARYYSAPHGRFTSVDPENAGADPSNPQSWNAYAYALNNPLKYTDPDGRKVKICDTQGNCAEVSDANASSYLFNRQYAKANGFSIDGKGKIFGADGNQIGTYVRTSFDDFTDQANAMIFGVPGNPGMVDRAPAIKQAIGAFIVTSVVGGATAGAVLYVIGPGGGLTTLGLSGTAGTGTVTEGGLASLSIQQLSNVIRGTQQQLLRRLFGQGVEGAQQSLSNLNIPQGLTREALVVYREIARRAIERGADKAGVQALRLKIIDEALKRM